MGEKSMVKIVYEGTEVKGQSLDEAKRQLFELFPEAKDATFVATEEDTYYARHLIGAKA
jgi:hypothetical protein